MKDYKYTPFNVLGIILFLMSSVMIIGLYKNFSYSLLVYPLFGLLFVLVDYFFQSKRYNFKKLLLIESLISIALVLYFIKGIVNTF